ncbi:tRNA (adenosine(37)-N6)-threonylcarbamoyltransferase complex ATPase subunit type 1 TsaE [Actinobacteria bacterium YIM 96077]|uniref:tRNA threonylcarbamoyladenosine biosynthesis protein TsaE n=1 Tax=Phytoactinopolyspora halophila TaxID=1981511 RepID=A0A329QGN4_9ACTN|nr:tRNA (adenosine(37)-N6)-threonylcarbamoyltransferase complex ATPase subunit type 1 TsaE [Phytoactinopolyspora halophila]AYY14694.1 tRNA (adenosine(37)-N6)-threonylcarbamoyltransferase complex ATPase subunit type 1 TsaE [Actinobacteria bacterium YIM 96077]RAW11595.1 tRNA (adenosine(37)-N6)-threonylcarbamoyltransferase complex ATPase subunit type 1 TsaE [Phytoactinopolyspora halophila]
MIELDVPDAARMHALGERLATLLCAGDLLLLGGDLGAGKTTLTQGIGAGLGVRGPVTSPTFVLARTHPSLVGGAPLVHVDAYRLGGWDELEDIDVDATLDESVTVVEWGEGLAEGLAGERLEIHIDRSVGPAADAVDLRHVAVTGIGSRWDEDQLRRTLSV